MNRRLRTALAVTAALSAGLLMTACGGSDTSSAPADATATSDSPAASGQESTTGPSGGGGGDENGANGDSGASDSSDGSNPGSTTGTGDSGGTAGDGGGVGQSCGSNDISWSASSETQAGGYFLIKAKAKPGITCFLPASLPVVAFGSDGTEAGPAEQSVGQQIKLRAGVTAYTGVQTKTTNTNDGKQFDSLILSVSGDDPHPVSVDVDAYVVDKPIVTNWHTSPADAVPFSG
ncbi:DUF4232 domain-containing protein [Streptomyces sp. NPDC050619]|uniref:DUF4232 domain-containing protein n=1 Tax=Streptomyces sp. NPDC050619 TaxID=3157214 RepID=UPI00344322C8